MNRKQWVVTFLSVAGLGLAMELWALFNDSPYSVPLTWIIIDNVPFWLGMPIIAGFAVWLVHHFYVRWKK